VEATMKPLFPMVLAVTLVALPANSQKSVTVEGKLVDFGIYVATTDSKSQESGTALGSVSTISKIEHVKETDIIPAVMDTRFGFRCEIQSDDLGVTITLTKRNVFPESGLKNPDTGKIFTEGSYDLTSETGEIRYIGYQFEEPWEIVVGQWTQQLWYEDQLLCSKSFHIE
jgi:hypothetical protein